MKFDPKVIITVDDNYEDNLMLGIINELDKSSDRAEMRMSIPEGEFPNGYPNYPRVYLHYTRT